MMMQRRVKLTCNTADEMIGLPAALALSSDGVVRTAATFTFVLASLDAAEQKAAKTTLFDRQMDPAAPGLKVHRVERCDDPHFGLIRGSGVLSANRCPRRQPIQTDACS